MIDVIMTLLVVVALATAMTIRVKRYPATERPWLWLALGEYLACGAAQFAHARTAGGDSNHYREDGIQLAKMLDADFLWASQEVIALLVHRPSAFDGVIIGAGSNTGSMSAAAGWVMFFTRHSEYGAQALVAGLAMFSSLAIYDACRDAYPTGSPMRLFTATVLFPSIAFWTSALHKEAFCLIGMGLLMAGWRAARNVRPAALVYGPLGVLFVLVFRAPALPPLLLGIVIHFVLERIRKARGPEATILGSVYLGVGLGALAVGMILVARASPELALDRLGESVARHQNAWRLTQGGSNFGIDDEVPTTLGGQLLHAPIALVNALFRPQLFDVRNPLILVSAIEMTVITWMLVRAIRQHGFRGVLDRIQRSPFLLMCTVITIVGCAFVGLTTRNFGSLARYRVPFLPFYGILLATLSERTATVSKKKLSTALERAAARRPPPRRVPAVATRRSGG